MLKKRKQKILEFSIYGLKRSGRIIRIRMYLNKKTGKFWKRSVENKNGGIKQDWVVKRERGSSERRVGLKENGRFITEERV